MPEERKALGHWLSCCRTGLVKPVGLFQDGGESSRGQVFSCDSERRTAGGFSVWTEGNPRLKCTERVRARSFLGSTYFLADCSNGPKSKQVKTHSVWCVKYLLRTFRRFWILR